MSCALDVDPGQPGRPARSAARAAPAPAARRRRSGPVWRDSGVAVLRRPGAGSTSPVAGSPPAAITRDVEAVAAAVGGLSSIGRSVRLRHQHGRPGPASAAAPAARRPASRRAAPPGRRSARRPRPAATPAWLARSQQRGDGAARSVGHGFGCRACADLPGARGRQQRRRLADRCFAPRPARSAPAQPRALRAPPGRAAAPARPGVLSQACAAAQPSSISEIDGTGASERAAGVEHRPGDAEDQRRRQRQAQHQQPPRRADRRLLRARTASPAGAAAERSTRSGAGGVTRSSHHKRRQRRQGGQRPGRGEAERAQAQHARHNPPPGPAEGDDTSASSAVSGGWSVRCVSKVQPTRCGRGRAAAS